MITTYQVAVTTTGSAGSAAGNNTTAIANGRLLAVYLDFHASAPATTDTTITTLTAPIKTLLTITNSATDAWVYPRALLQDLTGANLTAVYDALPVDDYIKVAVAQCDALTAAVTVYFLVER